MKNLNRRIARTRRSLAEALVDLVLERGYDNFSIKELTARADIGYATFYRHFKSVDELLSYVLMSEFEVLKQVINEQDSPYGEALEKYRHIARHPGVYRVYASLPRPNAVRQVITKELAKMFLERFEARDSSNVPLELAMNHVIDGSFELLRWYLDNHEQYSAEEVTAIYSDLLLRSTSSVAIAPRKDWLKRFAERQLEG